MALNYVGFSNGVSQCLADAGADIDQHVTHSLSKLYSSLSFDNTLQTDLLHFWLMVKGHLQGIQCSMCCHSERYLLDSYINTLTSHYSMIISP